MADSSKAFGEKSETARLVDAFADAVAKQAGSLDSAAGNRHARAYVAAFRALSSRGAQGLDALSILFDDPRAVVRATAAAFLLRHCTARARLVLEAEAKGPGLLAFQAQQALARWEDGTWELDK